MGWHSAIGLEIAAEFGAIETERRVEAVYRMEEQVEFARIVKRKENIELWRKIRVDPARLEKKRQRAREYWARKVASDPSVLEKIRAYGRAYRSVPANLKKKRQANREWWAKKVALDPSIRERKRESAKASRARKRLREREVQSCLG